LSCPPPPTRKKTFLKIFGKKHLQKKTKQKIFKIFFQFRIRIKIKWILSTAINLNLIKNKLFSASYLLTVFQVWSFETHRGPRGLSCISSFYETNLNKNHLVMRLIYSIYKCLYFCNFLGSENFWTSLKTRKWIWRVFHRSCTGIEFNLFYFNIKFIFNYIYLLFFIYLHFGL